jgi:cytidine deaminase
MKQCAEGDLSQPQITKLINEARTARTLSYAPYSHFAVGASVVTTGGKIYHGCNIENASYSLTICAERVAIIAAILAGEKDFQALAVIADTSSPVPPCGACRQVLAEFHVPQIIMANMAGEYKMERIEQLLPYAFTAADLS